MATNSFQKALSTEALLKAWKHLYSKTSKRSKDTVGIDGISINDYEIHHKANIAKLARELQNEEFRFKSLNPHFVPKPQKGKFRLISVPTVDDRIVQRALVEFLSTKYLKKLDNSISYGFVPGRSVIEASTRACQLRAESPWILKTDITSFFDMIPRDILQATIRKEIKDTSLHEILDMAVNCEVDCTKPRTTKRLTELGIKTGLGVRQGMPLSPFFANLLLYPLDKRLVKLKIKAVRYADDLVFFANSKSSCEQILTNYQIEINKLGLTLPKLIPGSKSVIYPPHKAAEFLGLELAKSHVGYQLRLSNEQREKIKSEILQLGSVKELISRRITLRTLGAHLSAKVSGYFHAYAACTNAHELENDLQDIEQKTLRNLYQKELGIKVNSVNAEVRRFLNLR